MTAKILRLSFKYLVALGLSLVSSQTAFAQSMPWETPLRSIQTSLQGPTAQLIVVIAIVASGLAFCLGESGGFFRRCAGIVFGAAIAIGASTFAATLFGF